MIQHKHAPNLSLIMQDHDKESNQYKPNSTQESLTYAALNHFDTAQTPISVLFYSNNAKLQQYDIVQLKK